MAKIIVTTLHGIKWMVDTNSRLDMTGNYASITNVDGRYIGPVLEPIEEIQRRINEAEAEATNAKLDLILANQEKIMKALKIQEQ